MISRRRFLQAGFASLMLPLHRFAPSQQIVRAITHGREDLPQICLTYDDLWDEEVALQIAEAYAEKDISITFFPPGSAITANINRPVVEDLYKQIYDLGHEFGCHLYTHTDITEADERRLRWWEVNPWLEEMENALGFAYDPVAIRPPMGIVTNALYNICAEYELPLVLWSVDMRDTFCAPNECEAVLMNRFTDTLENGQIYLLHTLPQSLTVIDSMLDAMAEAELAHVPLSAMLAELENESADDA
ncbi:MAG: hypothetical protein CUN56_10545 [Phototrophicales bacterium]|nr:MAG: hypothetical protein CUN56_10545 [Phototrophicales bacterium]RMG70239.1 MAG: polysaccharide deacetylase family protein [Chloroflexota bacterium]